MALTDVTTRLYASTAYRNTPVLKALSDAFVMNLKFRFSLVGMAAALTGSRTLYGIAQQKYLVSDEERKQEKNEIEFKKHVVTSLSTLSKQVSILESIIERNTLMISAISSDLGYFKGQRKMRIDSYGQLKSFKVPLNSKSVKGQIDSINAELQKLKGLKATGGSAEDKKRRIIEDERIRAIIAATVGASLAALGLKAVGANDIVTTLGTATAATLAAFISSESAQAAAKKIIGTSFPVIGNLFKLSLLRQLGAEDRALKRFKGEKGVDFTSFNSDIYTNNFDPRKNPLEWRARQREIEILKSFEESLETVSKPIDNIILLLEAVYGFKLAKSVYKGGRALYDIIKKVKPTPTIPVSATRTTGVAGVAGVAGAAGVAGMTLRQLSVLNQYRNMVNPITGKPFTLSEAYKQAKQQGTMEEFLQKTARVPGTPMSQAPRTTGVLRRVRASFANKKVLLALKRINDGLTKTKYFKFIAPAAILMATYKIYDMYEAVNRRAEGKMKYETYKETMVSGFKYFVDLLGATGIGAVVGTLVGGPLGLLAGASAGIAASFFMDEPTTFIAEKLFGILCENEPVNNISDIGEYGEYGEYLTPDRIANIAATTQAPMQVEKIVSNDKNFMAEVLRVSDEYNLDPSDLLAVMYRESRLDPSAKNPKSTATGLIQFTEATAKNLGTTTAALRIMSAAQQMKYVEKYFEYWKVPKTGISRGELYGYIFMPGRVSSGVFAVSGTDEYSLNAKLDLDDDQRITTADLTAATSMDGGKAYMAAAETARLDSGVNSALNSQILQYFAKDSASVASPPDSADTTAADAMAAAVAAQAGTMMVANNLKQLGDQTQSGFDATRGAIDGARAADKIPKEPAERMRDDSFDDKFVYA